MNGSAAHNGAAASAGAQFCKCHFNGHDRLSVNQSGPGRKADVTLLSPQL